MPLMGEGMEVKEAPVTERKWKEPLIFTAGQKVQKLNEDLT